MPRTATSCPRCRQPITAEIEQLFDLNQDPRAKQRLLGGQSNFARCTACGFEGPLSVPVVYHDPDKELLLTFFPPELGMPLNEQEKFLGPLLNQVMNKLPPEKRKAYLLRPQSMFTFDTMIEKILEGDGITKEMLDAQQKRLGLLQKLLSTSPDALPEVIKQEEAMLDHDFFSILGRVIESTMAQGDQRTARALAGLQQYLLQNTAYGQEIQKKASEAEDAARTLQEAAKNGLTREILLDVICGFTTDLQVTTVVGMVRQGMDYEFFQLLSNRIEAASGEEKERLTELRGKLIAYTQEIDKAINEQLTATKNLLEELLKQPKLEEVLSNNLHIVNELFLQVVQSELEEARKSGNFDRSGKLQTIIDIIEKLSAPSPELEFAQTLFDAASEEDLTRLLEENSEKITPEFVQALGSLVAQSEEAGQEPEAVEQFKRIHRAAMRHSMKKAMQ